MVAAMTRLALALVLFAAPALAGTSTWEIDTAHTNAQFAVKHLMVSTVRGTMGPVTGTVTIDDADLTKSTASATVDTKGVDTRNEKRDEHLRAADFFDVAKYPTMSFTSTKVEKVADGKFTVTGDLTLRGVTKPVVLEVEGSPTPITDPFGKTRIGGVATTRINRKDFGLNWSKSLDGGGLVVSDEVDITIDIELTKKN